MSFAEALKRVCVTLELPLSKETLAAATTFYDLLEKWSARIALTTVSDETEWAEFHFGEAFWAAQWIPRNSRLADIGSGAGFPGLPLAIYRPDLSITLLEKNFKKGVFLKTVASSLGLSVTVREGAAEGWPGWPDVDMALLRALRPSPALLETLGHAHVRLLHFRGTEPDSAFGQWLTVSEKAYPLARNRWVSLYSPPSDVPRGTK